MNSLKLIKEDVLNEIIHFLASFFCYFMKIIVSNSEFW